MPKHFSIVFAYKASSNSGISASTKIVANIVKTGRLNLYSDG